MPHLANNFNTEKLKCPNFPCMVSNFNCFLRNNNMFGSWVSLSHSLHMFVWSNVANTGSFLSLPFIFIIWSTTSLVYCHESLVWSFDTILNSSCPIWEGLLMVPIFYWLNWWFIIWCYVTLCSSYVEFIICTSIQCSPFWRYIWYFLPEILVTIFGSEFE